MKKPPTIIASRIHPPDFCYGPELGPGSNRVVSFDFSDGTRITHGVFVPEDETDDGRFVKLLLTSWAERHERDKRTEPEWLGTPPKHSPNAI